jgi:hypothetical protein
MTRRKQHGNPLKRFRMVFGKFQNCKFQRTSPISGGFVCAAGVQYVAENSLFTITTGFLSIKLWWRERLKAEALPSRSFGDGAQVQR